jgi:CBS domain
VSVTKDQFLAQAASTPTELTVRELLRIWGYRARNYESVAVIAHDLSAAGLRCEPDFAAADSSSAAVVVGPPVAPPPVFSAGAAGDPSGGDDADELREERLRLPPIALLVGHIPSATGGIMSVRPDESLERAQGLMTAHDYSQLAVMSGPRDLDGAVSWRSIARAGLTRSRLTLADATVMPPTVVHANDTLLEQIDTIYRHDFVFVQGEDHRIVGIVTTADLSVQFRDLTTPFFQLGECEGRLRRCIDRVFTIDEIRDAIGKNRLRSVEDMTFWEYQRLLDNDERWKCMRWRVERETFIECLNAARLVRNKVMHFGEELTDLDKAQLRQFYNFMRVLDPRY